jgi:transcriptional regulator with XRE-family HTH domain
MFSINVYQRIDYLRIKKGWLKRDLILKIQELEPTTTRKGTIPSESTLYAYFNGNTSIHMDLIPYIAEVLNVPEIELFIFDDKCRKDFIKYIVNSLSYKEIRDYIEP